MPKQYQLEGDSLPDLKAQILVDYGPAAHIVNAELVTVGGVWGFFARRHFQVTVQAPDLGASDEYVVIGRAGGSAAAVHDVPDRSSLSAKVERAGIAGKPGAEGRAGIAALLDDADMAEAHLFGAVRELQVSTGSDAFAKLMNELTVNTDQVPDVSAAPHSAGPVAAAVAPRLPAPLAGAGDLVLVVGLAGASLPVARSMAEAAGSSWIGMGGVLAAARAGAGSDASAGVASDHVYDRRSSLAARARGVEAGHSVFVAFGLDRAGCDITAHATAVNAIAADQIWVVVDAANKADDTAAWIDTVSSVVAVDAVAGTGRAFTVTPGTVDDLGLPVVWIDDDTGAWPSRQPRDR